MGYLDVLSWGYITRTQVDANGLNRSMIQPFALGRTAGYNVLVGTLNFEREKKERDGYQVLADTVPPSETFGALVFGGRVRPLPEGYHEVCKKSTVCNKTITAVIV